MWLMCCKQEVKYHHCLLRNYPIFPHFESWRVSSTTAEVNSTCRDLMSVSKTGRVQSRPSYWHALMISLSPVCITHLSFLLHFSCLFLNDHYFFCEEKTVVKRGKNKKQNQNKPKTTEQTKTGNHNSEKFYLLFIENRCISVWVLPFIYHPETKNPKHLCKHR